MFDVEVEFNKLWYAYDSRALRGTDDKKLIDKGSRTGALKKYKIKVKSLETANKWYFALVEQKKYHIKCKELNEWVPRFPAVVVWINKDRWDNEITDIKDLKNDVETIERVSLGECSIEGCNREIHGPLFNECSHHVSNTPERKKKVVQWFRDNDLMKRKDETREAFINRCKVQAKESAGRMNKRVSNV